ncbi:MAG: hypothetical protein QNJ51_30415, partial [Calothrix sp. MO_167.B12]|nr:hypothetical protein [Calothrix sp. MO_167.B12]
AVVETSDDDATATLTVDNTDAVTDPPVEENIVADRVEAVVETSDDDATATLTVDNTDAVTDPPVEENIVADRVEAVVETSDDATATLTVDKTDAVTDTPVEESKLDTSTTVQITSENVTSTPNDVVSDKTEKNQVKIEELPAAKSSTKKTGIQPNRGFGTNTAKNKSKASKKKKR